MRHITAGKNILNPDPTSTDKNTTSISFKENTLRFEYAAPFFEQEDIDFFKEGDLMAITFPDGSVSKGIIKRFYYATYPLPDEFQKRYEPTTRTIAADIYPVNDADYEHWRAFYKMSVTITKFKY